jgi:hypothetical protein
MRNLKRTSNSNRILETTATVASPRVMDLPPLEELILEEVATATTATATTATITSKNQRHYGYPTVAPIVSKRKNLLLLKLLHLLLQKVPNVSSRRLGETLSGAGLLIRLSPARV